MSRSTGATSNASRRVVTPGRWIPFAVVMAIAAFVLVPVLQLSRDSAPNLAPVEFPSQIQPAPPIPRAATLPAEARSRGPRFGPLRRLGALGEVGRVVRDYGGEPGRSFRPLDREAGSRLRERRGRAIHRGDLLRFDLRRAAAEALLNDVLQTSRPVVWLGSNIEQLERQSRDFRRRYGWRSHVLDRSPVP